MKTKTTKSKCFLHESSIFQKTQCLIKELLKWKGRNNKCIIINKRHTPVFISININVSSSVHIRWSGIFFMFRTIFLKVSFTRKNIRMKIHLHLLFLQYFFKEHLLEYCLMHSCFSRIRC